MRSKLHWLWLSLIVILLDQATKYLALHHLEYGEPMPVIPHLNLTLNFNTGAAFAFLKSAGGWQQYAFIGFAISVSLALGYWLLRLPPKKTCLSLALTLIIGGALGNVYDRISLGYVIDFFSFYIGNWYFAVFNVADSAISLGAMLLLCDLWWSDRKTHGAASQI